jgi:hypothetical protein
MGFDGEMIQRLATVRRQSQFASCLQILACAFVTGLSIPAAWFGFLRLSVMWPINTPDWQFIATATLICLVSYLAVGFLVIAIPKARTLPFNWFLLSVCGAFTVAIAYTLRRLPISQLTFSELLLVHFREVLGTTFWLSLFTLPISALVYYSTSSFSTRHAASKAMRLTAR